VHLPEHSLLVAALSVTLACLSGCGGGGGASGGSTTGQLNPTTLSGQSISTQPTVAGLPPAPGRNPNSPALPPFPFVAGLKFPAEGNMPGVVDIVPAFPKLTFIKPVLLTHAGDGSDRIFVVELDGNIRVFLNKSTTATSKEFLSLTVSRETSNNGLVALAFDPDYKNNGLFYVAYDADNPRRSVLSSFKVSSSDPDKADPKSEKILISLPEPNAFHNIASLVFGQDKMLYVSVGDGGLPRAPNNTAQNLGSLAGKVLRIDPHGSTGNLPYGVPTDNPFVKTTGARGEIWALGLRSPWRMSMDRQTGEFWIGDVGEDAEEEIDVLQKGGNYGWPFFEGEARFKPGTAPNLIKPVYAYGRLEGRCVIGGYVYRGSKVPALQGRFLYGDYPTGRLRAIKRTTTGVNIVDLGRVWNPASFGEDLAGEVYVVSHHGKIHRFQTRQGQTPTFPQKLSATGLFVDVKALVPHPALLPFTVQEPFWSDGAIKQRWIALPENGKVRFDPEGSWGFPEGTVLVKHFELPTVVGDPRTAVRLETRVLVWEKAGFGGYVYRWNEQGTDADLLLAGGTRELTITDPSAVGGKRKQVWTFPSRPLCFVCHQAGTESLGVRTLQLNHRTYYRTPYLVADQLDVWHRLGIFNTQIRSPHVYGALHPSGRLDASLDLRARSYLAANCSYCHRPGGLQPGAIDMRFQMPLANTNLVDMTPIDDLGIPGARLIKPGNKEASIVWQRMSRSGDDRMPPLGSSLIDKAGVKLIGDWIDSLK